MSGEVGSLRAELGLENAQFKQAIQDVNRQLRVAESEFKMVSTSATGFGNTTDKLRATADNLTKRLELQKEKVETLRRQYEQSVAAKGADAKETQNLEVRLNKASAQMNRLEGDLIKTNAEITKQTDSWEQLKVKLDKASESFGNIGKKLTDVGKNLSLKVTGLIVAAGTAALKMASDFENGMAKVSTLADESQISMQNLKKGVIDISNESGIAATEISGAVYDSLSAGVETGKALDFVRANVSLTKAGFTSMGTAIDATSTILNAYGKNAYDVTKIGDILVKTQDEGKITVDELASSIGRVIPTASSLGVNIDQLGASYAIMTAKGQNAKIATTNLNSMLGEMGKTGSKTDKALREMTGKSFKQLIEDGASVGDVLGILSQGAEHLGLSLSDMFGSTTAGSAALTLLSDGVGAFNEKVDVMNNSTGTMAENVEKLLTPSEKMSIAFNKIKNAGIELGAMLVPMLEKVSEKVQKAADWLGDMDDKTRRTVITVGALVAGIGPAILVVGKLSSAVGDGIKTFKNIGSAIKNAGGIIAWIKSPVGLAITAAAALVTAGVLLYKNWDKISRWLADSWNTLKEKFYGVVGTIMDVAGPLTKLLPKAWHEAYEELRRTVEQKRLDNIYAKEMRAIEAEVSTMTEEVLASSNLMASGVEDAMLSVPYTIDDAALSFDNLGASAQKAAKEVSKAAKEIGGEVSNNLSIQQQADMRAIQMQLDRGGAFVGGADKLLEALRRAAGDYDSTVSEVARSRNVDLSVADSMVTSELLRMYQEGAIRPVQITETINIYGNADRQDVTRATDEAHLKLVQRLQLSAPGVIG